MIKNFHFSLSYSGPKDIHDRHPVVAKEVRRFCISLVGAGCIPGRFVLDAALNIDLRAQVGLYLFSVVLLSIIIVL